MIPKYGPEMTRNCKMIHETFRQQIILIQQDSDGMVEAVRVEQDIAKSGLIFSLQTIN